MNKEYLVEYGEDVVISYVQPSAVGTINVEFIDRVYGDQVYFSAGVAPIVAGTYSITIPGAEVTSDMLLKMNVTYTNVTASEFVDDYFISLRRPYAWASEIASAVGLSIVTTPSAPNEVTQADLEKYERYAYQRIGALTVNEFGIRHIKNYFYGYGHPTIAIDSKIVSINSVHVNGELDDDHLYYPGLTGDSIYIAHPDGSYIINSPYDYPTFIDGARYEFDYLAGYESVPESIRQATIMLANDYRCNEYGIKNHYVLKTDSQFGKTEYDPSAFDGSGNVSVDQLIAEFVRIPMRVV
jgi:hypothetical protein